MSAEIIHTTIIHPNIKSLSSNISNNEPSDKEVKKSLKKKNPE